MRRIVLLGCAGSGKSALARRLSAAGGLELISLDALWPPGSGRNLPVFRGELATAHAGEAWVSEGNFAQASFDLRLPRADLVAWLERPRWLCLWRALLRPFRRGEPHQVSGLPRVLGYIWGFERRNRPLIETLRETHGPDVPVVRLRSAREIEAFVEAVRQAAHPPHEGAEG